MSTHTPGPWTFDIGVKGYHVYDAELCTVCTAREKQTARLIAAAPDLLAALKDIIGMAEAHADRVRRQRGNEIVTANIDASIAVARAAIAKAEGVS